MLPNYTINSLLILALPFGCYYLGIFIRKRVFPGRDSLSLGSQFLLGIPVSLIVVPSMIPVIQRTMTDYAVLVTLGLIVEQGMILNETATKRLKALVGSQEEDTPSKK